MLSNILSSCQAIMPQITVGGDLIVNLVHLGFLGKQLKT